MAEYQPGVCNIGRAERRKRYGLGVAGFVGTVVLVGVVAWLALPDAAYLLVIVPLLAGFEGYYQGRVGFCAGFAQRGIYDVSASGADRHEVESENAREADLKRARQIHVYAILSAAAVALVVYVVVAAA